MPTYEYRCKECSHEFEAVQSFTDDPIAACPACGGTVRKKFGAVGISFKGSGFYKTDSRSSGSAVSSPSGSSESSPSTASGTSDTSDGSSASSSKPDTSAPKPGSGSGTAKASA